MIRNTVTICYSLPYGKKYTYYQVTMKRAVTIKGSVSDGTKTCYTASDSGNIANLTVGTATAGSEAEVDIYMAISVKVFNDRYARFFTDSRDETLAAARHNDVNEFCQGD